LQQPHIWFVCLGLQGGKVLSLAYMKEVQSWAATRHIPVHLDGARVFNAAEALGALLLLLLLPPLLLLHLLLLLLMLPFKSIIAL
jgi:hypothetical protein